MNTRTACLLLIVIAHASVSAAPKFPLTLYASSPVPALSWSPDGKTLASSGSGTKYNERGEPVSVLQLLLWDAVNWGQKPKERILINNGELVREVNFFDPNDSNRLALDSREGCVILHLKRPKDKPRLIKKKHFMRRVGLIGAQGTNWSRDGKKIAFNFSDKTGGVISIVDPVDGKTLHTLDKRDEFRFRFDPFLNKRRMEFGAFEDWSPDGKYLVSNTGKSVVVFDAKLEGERFRFDPFGPIFNQRNASTSLSVKWDPDGTEIAFLGILKHIPGRKPIEHYVSFLDMKDLGKNEDPVGAPSRYKRDKPDRSFLMKDGKGNPILGPLMLAWSPVGSKIAVAASILEKRPTGGFKNIPAIFIYSKGGDLLHEKSVKNTSGRVARLEWSPDGFKIAASLTDGNIRVFKTPK
jgi:WD40 repeat protein